MKNIYNQTIPCNIFVKVDNNESLEKAIRRFRRKCKRSNLLNEMKKKNKFVSKSEKRNYIKNRKKFLKKVNKKYGLNEI